MSCVVSVMCHVCVKTAWCSVCPSVESCGTSWFCNRVNQSSSMHFHLLVDHSA